MDEQGLLLTYQSTAHEPVTLLGYVKDTTSSSRWTWQDETEQLLTDVLLPLKPRGRYVTACSVTSYSLFCFRGENHTSPVSHLEYILPGNVSGAGCECLCQIHV